MVKELSEEIKHFRLITGEDIIAQVMLVDKGNHTLSYPMKVIFLPNKEGTLRISLMEWIFSRISPEQTFDIKERDIMTISTPADVMVEYYWEALAVMYQKRKLIEEIEFHGRSVEEEEQYMDDLEEQVETEPDSDFIKNMLNTFISSSSNSSGSIH